MARPVVVLLGFAAWTVFVWATRLGNALEEGSAGSVALSLTFVLPALALGVLLARPERPAAAGLSAALAAWTVAVWLVRAVGIALDGHSAGFVVVHLALAAVSIALAAAAWRAQSQLRRRNIPTRTTVSTTMIPSANGYP